MTENDLVELYCIIDDFYQRFITTEPGKKNLAEYYGKRGPRRSMTVPEVMTLNIVRILDRTGDLKSFHKIASLHYRSYFPNLTNYENFMKASNKAVGFIAAFIQVQLYLNQENCNENTFFLDSTPVTVCENRYISSHKVAKAIASRGKSTKGWFYGFKLQGVCTKDGTLVKICFRPGSEHDRKSRFLICKKAAGKKAPIIKDVMIHALENERVETITPDRGKEFAEHGAVTKHPGGKQFYFPLPHHPWQRGTNENTNGLLREYFPKRKDITNYSDEYIAAVTDKISKRPRKCLGYKTPFEVHYSKTLHLI